MNRIRNILALRYLEVQVQNPALIKIYQIKLNKLDVMWWNKIDLNMRQINLFLQTFCSSNSQ